MSYTKLRPAPASLEESADKDGNKPIPFAMQTAGHMEKRGSWFLGLLEHSDGNILKPVDDSKRGVRELAFYQSLFDPLCKDDVLLRLRPLVPRYWGTFSLMHQTQFMKYVKLENLTGRYTLPSVMDIKIGAVTSDPEASPNKVEREREKYKRTKTLGFCIPGMKVYNRRLSEYTMYDKDFGKALTEDTVKDALIQFLGGSDNVEIAIVLGFRVHLEQIRDWFLSQKQLAFYSSSLLFVYEGVADKVVDGASDASRCCCVKNEGQWRQSLQQDTTMPRPNSFTERVTRCTEIHASQCGLQRTDVRMIDFAHVFPTDEADNNYIYGLNNVIKLFDEILRK